MQFRDLNRQYHGFKTEMDEVLLNCLERGDFISGQAVTDFENRLAAYCGVKHCVSCANGTDALVLALHALDVKPNDAIFVPNFTFFASAECVSNVGAVPVFVDVEEDTFNISPSSLQNAIDKVRADGNLHPCGIISVDLFGLPANYASINQIAEKEGLFLLEDAAQGFGGSINGRRACSFGKLATTSFFPAKPLGCYGDGGAIFTNDDQMADLMRSLRVHGKGSSKYDNVRIGYNSRLDTLQAEVLMIKMNVFDEEVEKVNKIAKLYTEKLASLQTPVVPEGYHSSWAQYTLRFNSKKQRDEVQAALSQAGIPSIVYYEKTMLQMKAFAYVAMHQVDACTTSTRLADTCLSLPMHPYLTEDEILQVTNTVLNAVTHNF